MLRGLSFEGHSSTFLKASPSFAKRLTLTFDVQKIIFKIWDVGGCQYVRQANFYRSIMGTNDKV